MYSRTIAKKIKKQLQSYRCVTLVGPRQSGKTTLCKELFAEFEYFTFESPDVRDLFEIDPRGFLNNIDGSAVFDEVQNIPELFSYLQEILDDKKDKRKFILTGSNNLKLSHKISQSLAGRTIVFELLPLQRQEIPQKYQRTSINETLFYGSYPRIYDENLNPSDWLGSYFQTYVERDVRDTVNITDIRRFNHYIRLLAGRVGQVMSFSSLGGDAGLSQPTAKSWFSALETSYICFSLQPHFRSFKKRITKAPKIYFYDTGLLCYLLRIKTPQQLEYHPLKGHIFENWVISEYMKHYCNQGLEAPLYFWRDQHGHEVDLVIDEGEYLDLIEIKSGQTFQKDFLKNINWLNKLQNRSIGKCIYGGDKLLKVKDIEIQPWHTLF